MMKARFHTFLTVLILCLAGLFLCAAVYAEENGERFPDGVIVVPQGTQVTFQDDAGTVSIRDCPVDIREGDTFIVYLQDLPIGYTARKVMEERDLLVVSTEKADVSVYGMLDEEGTVRLTPDMYEFIPSRYATSGTKDSDDIQAGTSLGLKDGKIFASITLDDSVTIKVELSELALSHSISAGNLSMSLNGKWKIKGSLKASSRNLGEVPIGEVRVYGVGKIGLSINIRLDATISYELEGDFSAGFQIKDGIPRIVKSLNTTQTTVTGEGKITVSLKMTIGLDILAAEADIYAEIGVATEYKQQLTSLQGDPPETIECHNYKVFVFASVGAEVKYMSGPGKMESAFSAEFSLLDGDNSPVMMDIHFENGNRVEVCSVGMDTSPENTNYGTSAAQFVSNLFSGTRDRVIENAVVLPWDITADGDLTIASEARLDLNGYTLILNGDLILDGELYAYGGTLLVHGNVIQNGGSLIVNAGGTMIVDRDLIQGGGILCVGRPYYDGADGRERGTLTVQGDYRIQSRKGKRYGDSSGTLILSSEESILNINGDFYLQTDSDTHHLYAGTIRIAGDMTQLNPSSGQSFFHPWYGCVFIFGDERPHTVTFADPKNNTIGELHLLNTVHVRSGLNVAGDISLLNGHSLTVDGDLILAGSDFDLTGSTVTVAGSLYHYSGDLDIQQGKLTVQGHYFSAGSDSQFSAGVYTEGGGYIRMQYAEDRFTVCGDFIVASRYDSTLTNGTLLIGGDFYQIDWYSRNFECRYDHKVILNGSSGQTVSFLTPEYSHFATLILIRSQGEYVITSIPCWDLLISPDFGSDSLRIPRTVTVIDKAAFERTGITAVYVPDGCASIGDNAFRYSQGLNRIRIPAECTIGNNAFQGCKLVCIYGTPGSPAEAYCSTHSNCMFIAEPESK